MSKKTLILSAAVILLLGLAGAGFYAYKKGFLSGFFASEEKKLTPEKLLTLEIKNSALTPEQVESFKERFNNAKETLQKDPNNFNAWLFLGVIKKGVGDYEGARDVFLHAADLRPQSSTPFANLADLYAYFLNEPQKAEESIKKAIANDSKDYSLYLALADIYRYKFPDGEQKYEKTMLEANNLFPDNVNLIGPLALFYRQTNQVEKAIEWYEKLVKLSPDNQLAKEDLAELKAKK